MDIEQEYVEYAGEFSLALFAASAAYFFDPSRLSTAATLLLIPVLFGYTAYISRDGFSTSAFLGFISLMFVPLNPTIAALSIFIALGNLLVSLFAGGERFRDYYSTTTLPLLLTGAVLGTGLFMAASNDPGVAEDVRNRAGTFLGEGVETAAEDAELMQQQRNAQEQIIRQTSYSTVKATEGYILNQTQGQFSRRDQQVLIDAFDGAEEDIPRLVADRAEQRMNDTSVDFSKTTENLVESNLRGKALLAVIPVTTLLLYSLQPIIGFLTAVSATAFSLVGRED